MERRKASRFRKTGARFAQRENKDLRLCGAPLPLGAKTKRFGSEIEINPTLARDFRSEDG